MESWGEVGSNPDTSHKGSSFLVLSESVGPSPSETPGLTSKRWKWHILRSTERDSEEYPWDSSMSFSVSPSARTFRHKEFQTTHKFGGPLTPSLRLLDRDGEKSSGPGDRRHNQEVHCDHVWLQTLSGNVSSVHTRLRVCYSSPGREKELERWTGNDRPTVRYPRKK